MADHRESRPFPAALLGDGLLLACALMGLAGSFLSLYGGGALQPEATALDRCAADAGSILAWAALFSLAALAAWSLPRFRGAAAGGLAGLWALALWRHWDAVSTGAVLTCKAVSDRFAARVSWGRTFDYASQLTPAQDARCVRLFLLLSLVGLALVLGWTVVRARRWWLAALLTLPPLLPGLLADLYPSWPPFMALCACWCAMLLCDLCRWSAPSRRGALTLAALAGSALVLAAATLAFPREGYTRPQWALDAEKKLQALSEEAAQFLSRLDGPFGNTIVYVGAAEEADLASAGPLRYTGRTVLRVTSDYGGRLYLRGSSLAVYEGGLWSALPEGTWREYQDALSESGLDGGVSPLIFPSLTLPHGGEYTAAVDNVGAIGTCVYAPYYLTDQDWQAAGMLPVEDAYLARLQGQWTHTMAFTDLHPYNTSATQFIRGLSAYGVSFHAPPQAGAYQDYVYRHYLDVPEELRGTLDAVYRQYGRFADDPVEAALDVSDLLDGLCTYDPEAPAAPEGTDPVLYFLSESRRGYCMHYASAAALMLRSLGIPARYVSGFVADCVPNRQVSVPDRAAHAWVEVWLDGFGWYPVEVTPAAAFHWMEPEDGPEDSEPLPSLPPAETAPPAPTPTPSQAPAPSQTPGQTPPPQAGDGPGGAEAGPADLLPLVQVPLALSGAVFLLWLAQRLLKHSRARRLGGPDPNRAALTAYGYLRRMERWGGQVDGRAVELAQKARFSQHTLTEEELNELRAMVDRERTRLCIILDPLPRLAFRWFWGSPRKKAEKSPENPRPPLDKP